MPTPQLILFLDRSGTLRAEVAGRNSTRRKLQLPAGAACQRQQMQALLAELQAQQIQFDAEDARLAAARQVKRVDPEAARQEKVRQAQLEHDRQWQVWLDSLPADQRAYQLAKRDKGLATRDQQEADRAATIRQQFPFWSKPQAPVKAPAGKLKTAASAASLGL